MIVNCDGMNLYGHAFLKVRSGQVRVQPQVGGQAAAGRVALGSWVDAPCTVTVQALCTSHYI